MLKPASLIVRGLNILRRIANRVFFAVWGTVAATPVFLYTRAYARSVRAYAYRWTSGKRRLLIGVTATVVLLVGLAVNFSAYQPARAAVSDNLNFQARLEKANGAIANDGNYNIRFRLYSASSGGSALWTESYLNSASQGVRVVNGYVSVNLGSVTAFPNNISWDQDMYITMEVGGTSTGTPTWDGEMNPRLKLTAVPYAFQAKSATQLQASDSGNVATLSFTTPTQNNSIILPNASGTVCLQSSSSCGFAANTGATGYIWNGTAQQTANLNIISANAASVTALIQGASGQTANIFEVRDASGNLSLGVNQFGNAFVGTNSVGGRLGVSTGSASARGVVIQGVASQTGSLLQLQDSGANVNAAFNGSGAQLTLGRASGTTGQLVLHNSSGVGDITLQGTATAGSYVLNLPAENGTLCSTGSICAGYAAAPSSGNFVELAPTGPQADSSTNASLAINKTGASGNLLTLQKNGVNVATIGNTGATLFQNSTNSTAAFQIQNAAGTSNLLVADTTNSKIGIGVAPNSGLSWTLQANSGGIYSAGQVFAESGVYSNSAFILNGTQTDNGFVMKRTVAGGTVNANDVVVMNSSAQTVTTSTARDTRVYGVAGSAATVGNQTPVAIVGNTTVNADATYGAIAIGDQLVTSPTTGRVMKDNNATTGILGYATSALASGTGTVGVRLQVVNGQSNPVFRSSTDSTTAFQIQNASGTGVFVADTTNGMIGVGGAPTLRGDGTKLEVLGAIRGTSLFLSGTLNNAGAVYKGGTATGSIAVNDVVIFNSSSGSSQLLSTTTTSRDNRIFGVAFAGAADGEGLQVAIAGNATVNADTAAIAVGDQLVTSTTAGRVTADNNATTGILGFATTSKAAGSNGTVGVRIQVQTGQYSPTFRNATNSTVAFRIQNAAGTNLFTADTTNSRLAVGSAAVPANGVLTVGTDTTSAAGGLYFGTDTNLYRYTTGSLQTDGGLRVGSTLRVQNGVGFGGDNQSGNQLTVFSTSAANRGIVIRGAASQTGDLFQLQNSGANLLTAFDSAGRLQFADGAGGSYDTNLYRTSATVLKTDGKLNIGTATTASGAQLVVGTGATNVTGLVVQAVSGQTADIAAFQSSNGQNRVRIDGIGDLYAQGVRINNGANNTAPGLQVTNALSTTVAAFIQGSSGQTADLLRLQDSGGNIHARFSSDGSQLTLGRAATSGTVSQGKLVLADGTTSGYQLTLQAGTLDANQTIVIPTTVGASDQVCLQSLANCTGTGGGIAGSGTQNYLAKFDTAGGNHVGNSIVYDNGSSVSINTNSTTAFKVEQTGVRNNTLVVDTTNGLVGIGQAPSTASSAILQVTGPIAATGSVDSGVQLRVSNASASAGVISKTASAGTTGVLINDVVVMANEGGAYKVITSATARDARVYGVSVSTGSSGSSPTIAIGGNYLVNADTGAINIGDQLVTSAYTDVSHPNGGYVTVDNNATTGIVGYATTAKTAGAVGTVGLRIQVTTGQYSPIFRNATDSTVAFQVQNAAGTDLLRVDTLNSNVVANGVCVASWGGVGIGTGCSNAAKLSVTTAAIGAQINVAGSTQDILQLQDDGVNVFTVGDGGATLLKNSADSTAALRVQNAAGTNLLVVDTTNQRLAVGPAAVPANGVLTVGTNTTTTAGGVYFGTDTVLYRNGTSSLRTSGNLSVDGNLVLVSCDTVTAKFCVNTSGTGANINVSGANDILNLRTGSTLVTQVTSTGSTLFRNATNSSAGFTVQNASSASLLNINTSNGTTSISGARSAEVGSWTTGPNLPAVREEHTGVYSNGYLYVLGGSGSYPAASPMNSVAYSAISSSNGSMGSWASATNLPAALFEGASASHNGYIYHAGGQDGSNVTGAVYYAKQNANGTLGSWATANALPAARREHTATVINGYLYIVGGYNSSGVAQATVYYAKINSDGSLGSWVTGTAMPGARNYHAAATANGYLYILGGQNGSNFATVFYAKPDVTTGAISAWTTSANPLPVAYRLGWAATANNYLYYIGGYDGAGSALIRYASLNALTGANGSWTTNATNRPTTNWFNNVVAANGYFYETGGGFAINTTRYAALTSLTSNNVIEIQTNGGNVASVNGSGHVVIQNSMDATNSFQIQNASGQSLFVADTFNQRLAVGPGAVPATSVLTVGSNTSTADGGITFGTDTSLYRFGSNVLGTDSRLLINAATGGAFGLSVRTVGDSNDRLQVLGNGTLQFGSGSGLADTTLYRSAANTLKTDDNFTIQTASDSATAFQVQDAAGTAALSVDTTTLTTAVQAKYDSVSTGSNLITTTDFTNPAWTSTGWNTTTTTATHNTGNTSALTTNQVTPVNGTTYQISYTVSGSPTTGSTLTTSFGGITVATHAFATTASSTGFTETRIVTASGSGDLSFTPSTSFNGIISAVEVRVVSQQPTAALVVKNAAGAVNLEVRSSSSITNTLIGLNSGNNISSGTQNTALGNSALQNNTTGSDNAALGYQALQANSTGINNTGLGSRALQANTVGRSNTAVGNLALGANTTGNFNTALGVSALAANVSGAFNTALGSSALQSTINSINNVALGSNALSSLSTGGNNTALGVNTLTGLSLGSNNIAIGFNSGSNVGSGNQLSTGSYNTFMGYYSGLANATQVSRSTAIGTHAQVGSSDSIILGCVSGINSCTNTTTVGIGTQYAPNALTVSPGTYSTGTISQSGTAITGSGTTFTSAMTAGTIYYSDGTSAVITAYNSATSLTVSVSKTVTAGATYTIVYGGFNVNSSGAAYLQPTTDTTNAFRVLAANSNPILTVDSVNQTVALGATASGEAKLYVSTGLVGLRISQIGSSNLLELQAAGTNVATVNATGAATFRNSSNSTTAFQIQNSAGTSNLFVADTTNSRIGIGKIPTQGALDVTGSIYASQSLFATGVIQNSNVALNAGVFNKAYNSTGTVNVGDVAVFNASGLIERTSQARDPRVAGVVTYSSGGVVNIGVAGNAVVNVDEAAVAIGDQLVISSTPGLATADNNATTGIVGFATSTKTAGSTGTVGITVRTVNGQSTPRLQNTSDSTTAFQIQNAAGTSNLFNADTTNTRIGIGTATPGYTLDVNGDVNTTGVFRINGVQIASSTLSDTSNLAKLDANQTFTGYNTFRNASDSTTAFQIQNAAGTALLTADTTNSQLSVRGSNSDATLGVELITTTDFTNPAWTSTGWNTTTTTATHNTGNTSALSTNQFSVVAGTTYLITYTLNIPIAGTLTPQIGGVNGTSASNNQGSGSLTVSQIITASTTGSFQLVPSSTFNGTVSAVSVKAIVTSTNNSVLQLQNSGGTTSLEVRASGSTTNAFVGLNAGRANASGLNNAGFGTAALQSNVTGSDNAAFGYTSLQNNVNGSRNTALGSQSLKANLSGLGNTAVGAQSLQANTYGSYNVAVGDSALMANTIGAYNNAVGYRALVGNTTGSSNVAMGISALAVNTTANNSTALGYLALGQSNAANSVGIGSAAGYSITSGANNTLLGAKAGQVDTDGFSTVGTVQNSTALGYAAQIQASNSLILGGTGANAVNVGIGTTAPANLLSISPVLYSTGTASRTNASATVLGTGTTWTSSMVGKEIIFADGFKSTIAGVADATTLTMAANATTTDGSPVKYRIHHAALQVTSSGSVGIGTLNPTATLDVAGDALFKNVTDSTAAFRIQNAAGSNLFVADTTNSRIGIGKVPSQGSLDVNGTIFASGSLVADGIGGCNLSYKLCVQTAGAGAKINVTASNNILELENNGTDVVTVGYTGNTIFRNSADSTAAFQVQNAAGTSIFNVDTTGGGFTAGTVGVVSNINGTLNVSNGVSTSYVRAGSVYEVSRTTSSDVTSADVLVYDSSGTVTQTTTARDPRVMGVARSSVSTGQSVAVAISGEATVKVDTGAVNVGDQLVTSTTVNRATVDNSATTGIIGIALASKAAGSNGSVNALIRPVGGQYSPLFRNAVDSTAAFRIQNAAGSNMFNVDTTTSQVGAEILNLGGSYYGARLNVNTAGDAVVLNVTGSSNILQLRNSGTNVVTVAASGSSTFRNSSNSTTAFQIQNSSGTNLFTVDTTNNRTAIGSSAVPANAALTIGTNTTTADGGMYFGTDTSLYRAGTGVLRTGGSFASSSVMWANYLTANQVALGYINGSTNGPGITFSSSMDTNLYRSAAGVLKTDSSFQVAGTGTSYVMGPLGLGTTNPQAASAMTIANGSWMTAVDSTGSGYVNMFKVNANNEIQVGAAMNVDGGIVLPTNGGQLTLVDMPIDATATASTPQSYSFRVGSTNALTVYGQTDGSGNAQNLRVAVGSSISPQYTLDVGGDINTSTMYRVGGVQIASTNLSDGSNLAKLNGTQTFTGANTLQNTSTTAFRIQNTGGSTTLFVADTTNSRIAVGPAAVAANAVLTVGTNTTTAAGGIYFGTDTALYRSAANTLTTPGALTVVGALQADSLTLTGACCGTGINFNNENMVGLNTIQIADSGAGEGFSWADATWSIDNSDLARSNTAGNLNLYGTTGNVAIWRPALFVQNATSYATATAGANGSLAFTSSGTGGVSFRNGSDSTTALQIQNAAGTGLFTADASNLLIKIGTGTPTLPSTGQGDLFVTGSLEVLGAVLIGTSSNGAMFDGTTHELVFTGTARHARTVTLAPSYAGSAIRGDGSNNTGTMSTSFCSGSSKLNIPASGNPCGANDQRTYYEWTANATNDNDIWVTYKLPTDFSAFDTNAFIFHGWGSTSSETAVLTVYNGSTSCGTFTLTGDGSWQSNNITASTINSNCAGLAAGDVLTIDVKLTVGTNGNFARAGEILVNYLSRY